MDREINKQTQASSDRGLCVKGCGFFGNPSFDGMCSMCFKDFQRRQEEKTQLAAEGCLASPGVSPATASIPKSISLSPSVSLALSASTAEALSSTEASRTVLEKSVESSPTPEKGTESSTASASEEVPGKRKKARCYVDTCRARLGLMGFDCRCGHKFCSKHRYSDQHDCTYDYKTDGRTKLEKSHPVVVAAKVQKL